MTKITLSTLIKIILRAIIIGCLATMFMDLWTLLIYSLTGHPVSYALIGHIVSYLYQGDVHFLAPDTMTVADNAIGWTTHYSIGCTYALLYEITVLHGLQRRSQWLHALLFAWILMVFPFCVLSPILGKGFFYFKTQHPLQDSLFTFSCHSAFGTGLWLAALISEGIKKTHVYLRWALYSAITLLLAIGMSMTVYELMK